MDFLGVGPLELLFIFLIALIVLGPTDMVKAGRTLGRLLRRLVTSPTWQTIQQTSRDIRGLPTKLIRDAGLEEDIQQLNKMKGDVEKLGTIRPDLGLDKVEEELKEAQADLSAWTTPPVKSAPPASDQSGEEAAPSQAAGEQAEQTANTETDKA